MRTAKRNALKIFDKSCDQCCSCSSTNMSKRGIAASILCIQLPRKDVVIIGLNLFNPIYKDHIDERPVLFIGGFPRSGTTLIRVMLDTHPNIFCGEETRVIPRILYMQANWFNNQKEAQRLKNSGISRKVINDAVKSFLSQIIYNRHSSANLSMFCVKDPFTLREMKFLDKIFEGSRFILMIRDPRAVAHSVVSRKITISGIDNTNHEAVLKRYQKVVGDMWASCQLLGRRKCLPVKYEDLVLQPNQTSHSVMDFLQTKFNPGILNHQSHINHIIVSKLGRSTSQVVKPINTKALTEWVGKLPKSVSDRACELVPMMKVWGYSCNADPVFQNPDKLVLKNEELIRKYPEKFYSQTFRLDSAGNAIPEKLS